MAEKIHLWNQPDSIPAAHIQKEFYIFIRQWIKAHTFRMPLEPIAVSRLQDN